MTPAFLLTLFIALRLAQLIFETTLASQNRKYYLNRSRQDEAAKILSISTPDLERTLLYSEDKYRFAQLSSWFDVFTTLLFLACGGLGILDHQAQVLAEMFGFGPVIRGVIFFGLIGILSLVINLPFSYYRTFVIEQKHGFNRQTKKGFFLDLVKGLLIGLMLGAPLLSGILWIMEQMGEYWWVYAWAALSGFSILTAWLYPTLLAPLFNKFTPIKDDTLKSAIENLAKKVGFNAGEIFVMDASKRSSHGNAYFTGVFGKKRIVLFDTLLDSMSHDEVTSILAHELGHFKLHHVRGAIIRSILTTGLMFYGLSLCLPLLSFYEAFGMADRSSWGALAVFSLWFGLASFLIQPLESYLSRKNEFAADDFAKKHCNGSHHLVAALLKLREKSHVMPITHPLFSAIYYSHPPLLERIQTLKAEKVS